MSKNKWVVVNMRYLPIEYKFLHKTWDENALFGHKSVVAKKSWQKTWDFGGCFGWATKSESATLGRDLSHCNKIFKVSQVKI